jgi:hypothetical protein
LVDLAADSNFWEPADVVVGTGEDADHVLPGYSLSHHFQTGDGKGAGGFEDDGLFVVHLKHCFGD